MRLGKVSDEKAEWYNTEVKDIMDLSGKKTAFFFAPFIYKDDHFTKTGSGQT